MNYPGTRHAIRLEIHKKILPPEKKAGIFYRSWSGDLEAGFALLRHTLAPAVLVENLFMDNPADCAFLLSPEGQQSLVDLHIDGIISYLGSL